MCDKIHIKQVNSKHRIYFLFLITIFLDDYPPGLILIFRIQNVIVTFMIC